MGYSDLLKTCRSCLRTCSKLRNLFNEYTDNGLQLSRCYEICANLEINEEDELPKMICIMCEANLIAAFYFRRQCIEAVNIFFKNCQRNVLLPPSPPNKFPIVLKQEVSELCKIDSTETQANEQSEIHRNETELTSLHFEIDTESEGVEDNYINNINMIVDKNDQPECNPVPFEVSPNNGPNTNIFSEPSVETEQCSSFVASPSMGPSSDVFTEPSVGTAQPNLSQAVVVLNESRYFQCPKCQKAFISDRHLEIHLKSHKKDLYECEICNRKCPSKSVLKVHLKKHRSITPALEVNELKKEDVYAVEYLYGFRPE